MKEAIKTSINYKVTDSNLVLTLLNVMYGVFFGVFAQYLININQTDGMPKITLLVNSGNLLVLSMFFIYFIVDWFSANITLLFENGINHLILIFAILFIFWLGFMMIYALQPNNFLYFSFGIYSIIASLIDIEVKHNINSNQEIQQVWKKYIFLYLRVLLALILTFLGLLLIANPHQPDISNSCPFFLILLIVTKTLRYFWLVYNKHSNLNLANNG